MGHWKRRWSWGSLIRELSLLARSQKVDEDTDDGFNFLGRYLTNALPTLKCWLDQYTY